MRPSTRNLLRVEGRIAPRPSSPSSARSSPARAGLMPHRGINSGPCWLGWPPSDAPTFSLQHGARDILLSIRKRRAFITEFMEQAHSIFGNFPSLLLLMRTQNAKDADVANVEDAGRRG
eukprot:Gb_35349 [translate_table: standard]